MKTECISEFVNFNDKTYSCPISVAMNLVGGKWKAVIIYHLQHEPKRFSELRGDLVSVTDTTLPSSLNSSRWTVLYRVESLVTSRH
mgnify:CR=1 FL=1